VLIGSEWFTDDMPDLRSKDARLQLRGKLLIEWAEMIAANRSQADRIKAFITAREDTFRAPYGRTTRSVPRVCSFAGTTNFPDYLDDSSGGRRFWPVECSEVDVQWIAANRRLLWRLACEAEALGEDSWIAAADLQSEVIERQAEAQRADPWEERVLAKASPGVNINGAFVMMAVGKAEADQTNGDLQRVAKILRNNGWWRERKREGEQKTVGERRRPRRWYPKGWVN
jgi:putative DNA primase/helicase